MSKHWISIHFKMRCRFPNRMSKKDVQNCARMASAAVYLDALAAGDGATGDSSHMADLTDCIESLANIVRRAKATGSKR